VVHDRRDAVVRRDLEKLRRELLAFADVDRLDGLRETGLFEEDGDFMAVRRGPVVEIDHASLPSLFSETISPTTDHLK
jgi:hypothetical protein